MYTIYVPANGELFVEGLNAITAFIGDTPFQSLIKIAIFFSIFFTVFGYIKSQDLMTILKWFGTVIFVTAMVLAPKSSVSIYDSSSPGKALAVDNAPTTLAIIASLITGIGYETTQEIEMLFTLPDNMTYNETGLLFGAKMFSASHSFQILNPELHAEMDSYIQNCVLGDILINKKYTLDELNNSTDLWETFSTSPSPVRGILMDGEFKTCAIANSDLKAALETEINETSFTLYGKKIFSGSSSGYEALFNEYLAPSYQYFINASQTASEIFMQSMLINAMNDGIRDYAAMTHSPAGLENYVNTKGMSQLRMTWSFLGKQAAYLLPLIQTVLLLLVICLFPFVALFSMMPNGTGIWIGYLKTLVWLELWPILFAILNMAMNFYLQDTSKDLGANGVSMMNMNSLAQLHSDTSSMAGYMCILIPFLAKGLLTGMMEAFSGVYSSMLGTVQGVTTAPVAEAVAGNFSVGNASYQNVSANNLNSNKHDTNWTDLHGMATTQLSSGVTKTMTESGTTLFNATSGMSTLAQNVRVSEQLASTLTHGAEHARGAAMNQVDSYSDQLTQAGNHFVQLGDALGHDHRAGEGFSKTLSTSEMDALANMDSHANEVSQREHISKSEAFQHLGQASAYGKVGFDSDRSALGKVLGVGFGVKGEAGASYTNQGTSTSGDSYGHDGSHGITAREASDFRHDMSVLSAHQKTEHSDTSNSKADNLLDNFVSDLRNAQTTAHNIDANLNESQRLSEMASFVESNSAAVESNLNQSFVDYVIKTQGPAKADSLFGNPQSLSSQMQLQALAGRFVSDASQNMVNHYDDFKKSINPDQFFREQAADITQKEEAVLSRNTAANQELKSHMSDPFEEGKDQALRSEVNTKIERNKTDLEAERNSMKQEKEKADAKIEKALDYEKIHAQRLSIIGVKNLLAKPRDEEDKIK